MTEDRDVVGFLCNLHCHNSTSFFNSMINIFISTYADSETWDYYYYFVDQPTWNNSQNCPYHKKLSCLCLTDFFLFFLNWDSLHTRLNCHYEAQNYKKKKHKKITAYREFVQKKPAVKRCLLILDLKPLRS